MGGCAFGICRDGACTTTCLARDGRLRIANLPRQRHIARVPSIASEGTSHAWLNDGWGRVASWNTDHAMDAIVVQVSDVEVASPIDGDAVGASEACARGRPTIAAKAVYAIACEC